MSTKSKMARQAQAKREANIVGRALGNQGIRRSGSGHQDTRDETRAGNLCHEAFVAGGFETGKRGRKTRIIRVWNALRGGGCMPI
jgi:hypothetical protein